VKTDHAWIVLLHGIGDSWSPDGTHGCRLYLTEDAAEKVAAKRNAEAYEAVVVRVVWTPPA